MKHHLSRRIALRKKETWAEIRLLLVDCMSAEEQREVEAYIRASKRVAFCSDAPLPYLNKMRARLDALTDRHERREVVLQGVRKRTQGGGDDAE